MNICFLTMRLVKHDAASNFTSSVMEELSKRNKVDLYAFSIDREIPKGVNRYSYTRIKGHNLLSVLFAITKIYSLAKKFSKYDILILASPDITILPSSHLAKHFNPDLKLIWDFHGLTPPQYLSNKYKLLTIIRQNAYFWSMKRSDCIKVDSNYIKREIESKIGKKDITVLPIGINIKRFINGDMKTITEKQYLEDNFVMIYVGRLAASKRIEFLIEAMQAIERAVLLIVGTGDEMDKLMSLVNSLNLKDKIIFVGRVSDEDLPKYYANSDVFVTASLHEGFCVPVIEALASGKPVIVPNRTAMPETAGYAGLFYDPESVEDFVSKVMMLRANNNLRERLARKALDRSREFDLLASVKEYEGLLKRMR